MSDQITEARVQKYKGNVAHLLQQRGSKLRKGVMTSAEQGKGARPVTQIGAVNPVKRTNRHGDTPLVQTPHDARWVHPVDYEWADLIDKQDELRMISDMKSPYAVNGAYAMGRAQDDEIIAAFSGTSKTGEEGGTDTSLPAAQTIAVGGTGLTLAKLKEAKQILMAAEVDIENDILFMAITALQHTELLDISEATTVDSNNTKVLVNGKVTAFMGFNFIHSERLTVSSGDTLCPAWAKSGMHLGIWGDIVTRITERADKSYSTQVYCKTTIGATRLEEEKIVMVTCNI